MKTYSEIFDSDIIKQFGGEAEKVGNIGLQENAIDVKQIAQVAGYSVKFTSDLSVSGKYDEATSQIEINSQEPEYRQRFTIAHELGHAVNQHPGTNYRATLINDDPQLFTRINNGFEIVANQFAARLLMPRVLVDMVLKTTMAQLGIDAESFGSDELAKVIYHAARTLNVSESALRYRIKNLNLIEYRSGL